MNAKSCTYNYSCRFESLTRWISGLFWYHAMIYFQCLLSRTLVNCEVRNKRFYLYSWKSIFVVRLMFYNKKASNCTKLCIHSEGLRTWFHYKDVVSKTEGNTVLLHITCVPIARLLDSFFNIKNERFSYPILDFPGNVKVCFYRTQRWGWMSCDDFLKCLGELRYVDVAPNEEGCFCFQTILAAKSQSSWY